MFRRRLRGFPSEQRIYLNRVSLIQSELLQHSTRSFASARTTSSSSEITSRRRHPAGEADRDIKYRNSLKVKPLRRETETEIELDKSKDEQKDYQKRYDRAARKWMLNMIALPIFLVTGYCLFERLIMGHAPKTSPRITDNQTNASVRKRLGNADYAVCRSCLGHSTLGG
ncbi:uncharacterized protein UV8b_03219 [Ustilaginoidea virens]|uniref:Uncharacterized protein n=1 Tax=Ustilaginoidea virens TaxID=1159556 RepID=A0A8E5MFZ7_USTVR|nr:uncharacterized protein UV8b_03219 [Ustilaginoidea virens]QUC18978.1 hypothetical protein UV8b_03219 [Ustilaginoidea virens]